VSIEHIKSLIRDVPDFPKPGIVFKDITPLLGDAAAFEQTIELLAARIRAHDAAGVVAIESRGFLFGAPLAVRLGVPLVPVRKPGKLPYETVGLSYDLEYGTDRVEMHVDGVEAGRRYALVDDVIATGGTAAATARLIELQDAKVACCAFLIELSFLGGMKKLADHPIESLIRY
jgi:adenine phosphoribosyltransferase